MATPIINVPYTTRARKVAKQNLDFIKRQKFSTSARATVANVMQMRAIHPARVKSHFNSRRTAGWEKSAARRHLAQELPEALQ